jgi:hypothetical protein
VCVGLCPYRLLVLLLLIYCYFLFVVVVVVVPMLLSSMLRNVALMISALKQNSLPYTPHLIKRALENTAKAIPNMTIHDIGHGLIQTYDAYTWITKFGRPDMNLWTTPTHMQYQVYRRTPGGMARGVYLRDAADLARPLVTKIGVKPSWREVGNSIGGHTKRDRVRNMFVLFYVRFVFVLLLCFDFIFLFKHRSHLGTCFSSFFSSFFILFHPFLLLDQVEFQLRATLTTTARWVQAPDQCLLAATGKEFDVRIDPTGLQPGMHYAEIQGRSQGMEPTR